ncbi:unnamed protein product [Dicrocoelium dendriticum]|nr:unnamed protein product [Dicrocoelium dendriticum]
MLFALLLDPLFSIELDHAYNSSDATSFNCSSLIELVEGTFALQNLSECTIIPIPRKLGSLQSRRFLLKLKTLQNVDLSKVEGNNQFIHLLRHKLNANPLKCASVTKSFEAIPGKVKTVYVAFARRAHFENACNAFTRRFNITTAVFGSYTCHSPNPSKVINVQSLQEVQLHINNTELEKMTELDARMHIDTSLNAGLPHCVALRKDSMDRLVEKVAFISGPRDPHFCEQILRKPSYSSYSCILVQNFQHALYRLQPAEPFYYIDLEWYKLMHHKLINSLNKPGNGCKYNGFIQVNPGK